MVRCFKAECIIEHRVRGAFTAVVGKVLNIFKLAHFDGIATIQLKIRIDNCLYLKFCD